MLRGGSWNNKPRNCRSANRNRNEPANTNNNNGFRVVRSPASRKPPWNGVPVFRFAGRRKRRSIVGRAREGIVETIGLFLSLRLSGGGREDKYKSRARRVGRKARRLAGSQAAGVGVCALACALGVEP